MVALKVGNIEIDLASLSAKGKAVIEKHLNVLCYLLKENIFTWYCFCLTGQRCTFGA